MKNLLILAILFATATLFSSTLNAQNQYYVSAQGSICITCDTVKPLYEDLTPEKPATEIVSNEQLFDSLFINHKKKFSSFTDARFTIKKFVFQGISAQLESANGTLLKIDSVEFRESKTSSKIKIFTFFSSEMKFVFTLTKFPAPEYREINFHLVMQNAKCFGIEYLPNDEKNRSKYKSFKYLKIKI